tara:strand:+ start:11390 stop:11668 length:279 start_codon:yes stop_codon:yes gene_type:complete
VVITGTFKNKSAPKKYNGDVYSSELKLYQLEIESLSPSKAYLEMVDLIAKEGVELIRFIEIYVGGLSERKASDHPVLIHHETTDETPLFGQS